MTKGPSWFALLILPFALAAACGGSDTSDEGSGGTGATGGSGGSAASGGSGGSAASGGSGGSSGNAGSGGGGTGGSGGTGVDASSGDGAGAQDAAPDVTSDADPACGTISQAATTTAHLRITADNECEVFVNGASVGTTSNWAVAVSIDVSLFVYPGIKNVIAVKGTNTSSQPGNDRGIIGELTVDVGDAPSALVVTDASWRVSTTEISDWTLNSFDAASWIAATEIANHGDGPWGPVLTTTGAKWIWSALVPADVANKPNLESSYVRREFYFATDGSSISDTPGCP